MSTERSVLVAVPRTHEATGLIGDIVSAAERADKADPGDRSDIVRYESLSVQLESLAHRAAAEGAELQVLPESAPDSAGFCFEDPRVAEDPARLGLRLSGPAAALAKEWSERTIVVELRDAFAPGAATLPDEERRAAVASEVWRAEDDATGREALEQRFRNQLEAVLAQEDGDGGPARDHAITPAGVHNRVLTEVLRKFVIGTRATRLDAPVLYRDGSRASNDFPLRCLELVPDLPENVDRSLHLALLSIRHTEMDPVVDGAWLRNAEVSRPRPAALTDDFVYETSMTQLAAITDGGRLRIILHMYQTGLETAVVGFYRAVVDYLLEHPHSLSVVPMFFASGASRSGVAGTASFQPGDPWTLGART